MAPRRPARARPSLRRAYRKSYKLLRHEPPLGVTKVPPLELFDMERDPLELHDIAKEHPDIVSRMHADYKAWFKDVSSTRGFEPVRIARGKPAREPHDSHPPGLARARAPTTPPHALGFWEVDVAKSGRFDITLHFTPRPFPSTAHIAFGARRVNRLLPPGQTECSFKGVNCLRARGDWRPGSRGTRPRPACSM